MFEFNEYFLLNAYAIIIYFILKGVDIIDHTSIFLLRTINHYVTIIRPYYTTLLGYLSAGDTLVGKTLKRFRLERIMKVYTL